MDFEKAILIPMQEDGLDLYQKEYNNMFLDNQAIVQVAASQEEKAERLIGTGMDLVAGWNGVPAY